MGEISTLPGCLLISFMDWKVVPFQESENLRMFYYSKRLKASNKIEMWLQLRKLLCQETISKIEYIIRSTRDANERVKNKKHGNYLQWSDFFVYAFFDKIIQFLSKPEIRHLFSKKILRRLERFIPIVHEPSINTGWWSSGFGWFIFLRNIKIQQLHS